MINTSSTSGLFGNVGQTNYGAAKTGIATFSMIADNELARYGVRVNAIAPAAATRLTAIRRRRAAGCGARTSGRRWTRPTSRRSWPTWPPRTAPSTGGSSWSPGGQVHLFQPFAVIDKVEKNGLWTIDELRTQAAHFAEVPFQLNNPYEGQIG